MRIIRLTAAASLLTLVTVMSAYAQGAGSPAGGAGIPATKIAYVDTVAFGDEKGGITKFVAAMKSLEREFQPRQTELQGLQTRINAIADDIKRLGQATPPDQRAIQAKQEEGQSLERQLEFKKKDAEAALQKRQEELLGPIYKDIFTALEAFSKQRGATMLLDVSKLAQIGAILSASDAIDLTKAFIADYNSRNPSTASR
jgi:Skp family chaperone for outer membrane proteins